MGTFPCLESTPGNYTVLWLKIAVQYCIASIGSQLQCWASTTQSLGHLAGIFPIAALFISSIVSASSFAFAPSPLKPNLLSVVNCGPSAIHLVASGTSPSVVACRVFELFVCACHPELSHRQDEAPEKQENVFCSNRLIIVVVDILSNIQEPVSYTHLTLPTICSV